MVKVGQSPSTFTTSAHTKTVNTVTIDASVLATSNGHSEKERIGQGSTSKGSLSSDGGGGINGRVVGAVVLGGLVAGMVAVVGLPPVLY